MIVKTWITLQLEATRVALHSEDHGEIVCLKCMKPLDLHQPDLDCPDRLLGICTHCCDHCGSWHVVNIAPGGNDAVIALLPDGDMIRQAHDLAQKPAPPKRSRS